MQHPRVHQSRTCRTCHACVPCHTMCRCVRMHGKYDTFITLCAAQVEDWWLWLHRARVTKIASEKKQYCTPTNSVLPKNVQLTSAMEMLRVKVCVQCAMYMRATFLMAFALFGVVVRILATFGKASSALLLTVPIQSAVAHSRLLLTHARHGQ